MKKLLLGAILLFSVMSCSTDDEVKPIPEIPVAEVPPVTTPPIVVPPVTTPPVTTPPIVVPPVTTPPVTTPPIVVPPITIPFNVYTKHGIKVIGIGSFSNNIGDTVFGITTQSDITDYEVYIHYSKPQGMIYIYKWKDGVENIKSFKVAGITRTDNGETNVVEFNCGTTANHLNGYKYKMIRVGREKKIGGKCWISISDSTNPSGSLRFYTSLNTVDFDINTFENGLKE